MKKFYSGFLLRSVMGLGLGLFTVLGVDQVYQNDGSITVADTPPQVDALEFINNGSLSLSIISHPYETRNTISFINRGIIRASPGIRFETITHQSVRTPANSFVATAGSRIEVSSSQLFQNFNFTSAELLLLEQQGIDLTTFVIPTENNPFQDYQSATLTISAKTVDIRGRLQTDVGSSIEISGTDVRLINASIYGEPPPGSSSIFVDSEPDGTIDYVIPPIGVTPLYGLPLDVGVTYAGLVSPIQDLQVTDTLSGPVFTVVDTATAVSPRFRIRNEGTQLGGIADDRLPSRTIDLGNSAFHSYFIVTNAPTPTNQTVRAAFVGGSDPSVLVDLIYGFGGSMRLLIGTTLTNVADGGVDLIALSLDSSFPTEPRLGFVPTDGNPLHVWPLEINSVERYAARSIPITRRDAITGNITNILSRSNLLQVMRMLTFSDNPSTNAPFRPDLFTAVYLPTNLAPAAVAFTNMGATNPFVAFAFNFRSLPSDTELINAGGRQFLTNNLGRVAIKSKTLDLSRTRIESQGPVVIETDDLISSAGSAIDAPYLSLNLGNAAGDLKIQGIIRPLFETLSGTVEFFSSTWTNSGTFPDLSSTNVPPPDLIAEVGFQYTVANVNLTRNQLTRVHDLIVRSAKVTIEDSGTIEALAAANTTELNINGRISLQTTLTAAGTNLINLKRLNVGPNGSLEVPNLISLGSSGNKLESVSAAGQIEAAGIRLNSQSVAVGAGGAIRTFRGTMDITADTLTITDSVTPTSGIRGSGPSAITAGTLNLVSGAIGVTNAALRLTVLNNFSAPAASGGVLSVPNGLEFSARPAAADLSGLTIHADVPPYVDASFKWPGSDMGAVVAGFTGPNNLAIKSLVVGGDNYSTISFSGPDARNALYVQQIQFLPGAVPVSTNISVTTDRNGNRVTNEIVTPNLGYVRELLLIPSSFTIYFGSAVTDTGIDISDALDRVIPERLRLVKLPVAPGGLVNILLDSGETLKVPVMIVESLKLDSDGDGVVNRWDRAPFESVRLAVESAEVAGETLVKLSFMAGTGGKYQVEASSHLGEWSVVETIENTSFQQKPVELFDRVTAAGGARNYRVRYSY